MNRKIYYLLITFIFSIFFFVRCTEDYTTFDETNKDHNHTNEKLNNLLNYLNLNSEEDLKEHLSDFIDNDFKLNIDFYKITETKNKDGIIDKVALYAENLDSSNNVFYNIVFVKKNDEIITYLVSYALDKSSTTRRFVTKVVKSNNKRQSRCGGNEFYTVEMFSCPAGHGSDCNIGGCCNGCWRLVGQGFTSPEECDNPFPFDGSGDGGGSNGGSPNYSPEYLRLNNMILEMNVKFGYKLTQPQWDNFHNYPAILTKFHSSVMSSEYSNATYLWAIAYLYDNISAANYFNQNPQDLNVLFALGIDFFTQNPNLSWDYLENWFFKKQIETENHPVVDPNLIIFDSPVQQSSLPSFNTFLNNFPKKGSSPNYTELPTSDAYKLAGGSLWDSHLNQRDAYNNACAIRGSRGLLYSGFDIPILRYNGTQRTQKGGDGKNYILDAVSFNKFMLQKFGDTPHKLEGADANDPKKVANLLKNKNGIYVIINDKYPSQIHYSGHVDTIINGKCIGGAYTTPNGGVKSIRVWVLN